MKKLKEYYSYFFVYYLLYLAIRVAFGKGEKNFFFFQIFLAYERDFLFGLFSLNFVCRSGTCIILDIPFLAVVCPAVVSVRSCEPVGRSSFLEQKMKLSIIH